MFSVPAITFQDSVNLYHSFGLYGLLKVVDTLRETVYKSFVLRRFQSSFTDTFFGDFCEFSVHEIFNLHLKVFFNNLQLVSHDYVVSIIFNSITLSVHAASMCNDKSISKYLCALFLFF